MTRLLPVLLISKAFQTFSKSHEAAHLFLTGFATQHAAGDDWETFFLILKQIEETLQKNQFAVTTRFIRQIGANR